MNPADDVGSDCLMDSSVPFYAGQGTQLGTVQDNPEVRLAAFAITRMAAMLLALVDDGDSGVGKFL